MSGGAGLHADQARPQPREEPKNLSPTQLPAHHHPACRIDPMDLENALRQVQTDRANFLHGRLLSIRSSPTISSWHVDAVAGAVHPISLKKAGLLDFERDLHGANRLRAPVAHAASERRASPRPAARSAAAPVARRVAL